MCFANLDFAISTITHRRDNIVLILISVKNLCACVELAKCPWNRNGTHECVVDALLYSAVANGTKHEEAAVVQKGCHQREHLAR